MINAAGHGAALLGSQVRESTELLFLRVHQPANGALALKGEWAEVGANQHSTGLDNIKTTSQGETLAHRRETHFLATEKMRFGRNMVSSLSY